jgi:hypothetical protein
MVETNLVEGRVVHKCVFENVHSSIAIEKRTHVDRELF